MKGIFCKLALIACLAGLLVGCAHTADTFDCKFEKGVGCRSISEVNNMVNRGEIKGTSEDGAVFQKPVKTSSVKNPEFGSNGMIGRVNEQHLRVWLAPFQDEQGNFHEASVVHTVLKPGYWEWRKGA